MQKVALKTVEPETESESELEQFEDEENRLSDDEDFPISEDEAIEDDSGKKKGWASSMAKVLNSEKSGVLSKAKKVEDLEKKKEKKSYNFEIEGESKTEKDDEEKPSEKALKRAMERRKLREKREVINKLIDPIILLINFLTFRTKSKSSISVLSHPQLISIVSEHSRRLQRAV